MWALLAGISLRTESNDLPVVAPAMDCAKLANAAVTMPDGVVVKITKAAVSNGRVPYCGIRGAISSTIRFEAQLPLNNWSQRYLQLGCGGLCGSLRIMVGNASGCVPAQTGALVLATTDMGHEGSMGGEFGANAQARIDFAYRGVHLTAVAMKEIIRTFYGKPARYSYFSGCSDGGREALMEAQRFPGEFNGIAAGAPAMNFQLQNTFYHAWQARSNTGKDGQAILTAERLPLLHRAAVASCDAVDGLKDGQITDPRQCRFDPAKIQCPDGKSGADCLSAEEASAARALYAGAHAAEGQPLVIGGPQVGSELAWAGVFVPRKKDEPAMSAGAALSVLRYLAFEEVNPAFALKDLVFDRETFERLRPMHTLYDATDTNLRPFGMHGGKLILWHGWSDPHISPINTIAYFETVQKQFGKAGTDEFVRLFLFPGMYHCNGGDGPSQFDVLTPLMSWVETGTAPAELLASSNAGASPDRTRPVYPYPAIANYRGTGSIDAAASFTATPGAVGPATYNWIGRSFISPGFHQPCAVHAGKVVCQPD